MNICYCSKCRQGFLEEENGYTCPVCGSKLIHTNITSERWNSMSPEELEKAKNLLNRAGEDWKPKRNSIGMIFRVLGIIAFFGSIITGGVVYSFCETTSWLNGLKNLGYIVGFNGCLGALSLLGFGEIILLLQEIRDK